MPPPPTKLGKNVINAFRKNTRITLSTSALCSLALLHGAAQAQGPTATYASDHVILAYKPTAVLPASSSHITSVGTLSAASTPWRSYLVQLDPGVTVSQAIATLQQNSDVAYAEPDYYVTFHAPPIPNDQYFTSNQYGPQQIRADAAWGGWQPFGGVTIAVVDVGVDRTHPDLTGKTVAGYNSVDGSSNTQDDLSAANNGGHGTFIAGIAGADINNGVGIAGIAGWSALSTFMEGNIHIMPIKIAASTGQALTSATVSGINWAVANHTPSDNLVINVSSGITVDSTELHNAVDNAWNSGCLVVSSAGSDGFDTKNYPAAYNNVISVASTNRNNQLDSRSNFGSWVLTAAPGTDLYSLTPGGNYKFGDPAGSGATSYAAPHVAGEAALLWTQNRYLTNQDIYTLITRRTDPYTPSGSGSSAHTIAATGGRINVYKALLGALGKVIATPDLDGDGKGDLIWLSPETGMVSYWTLDPDASTGIKSKGQLLATQDRAIKFVGYTQVNTGVYFFFWQNSSTGNVLFWQVQNTSSGPTVTIQLLYANPTPGSKVVAVADLNLDGIPDLVLQNPATGNVSVSVATYTTNSSGQITSINWPTATTIFNFNYGGTDGAPWNVVGAPRLDTTLPATILLQNKANGSVYYWMLKKDTNGNMVLDYNNYLYQLSDQNWKLVATPTINGTSEILFKYQTTGSVYYWLINKGSGSASNPPTLQSNGTLATLTDVNWNVVGTPNLKTGQPGVLLQNATTGGVYYWNLNSTGTSVGLNNYVLASP